MAAVANKELVRLMKESPVGGWNDAWCVMPLDANYEMSPTFP